MNGNGRFIRNLMVWIEDWPAEIVRAKGTNYAKY